MRGGNRANRVVGPFAVPAGNRRIEERVAECEEQLHIRASVVVVLLRNDLGEQSPMTGGRFGVRTVCPVVGNGFFRIVQAGTVAEASIGLSGIVLVLLSLGIEGGARRTELRV